MQGKIMKLRVTQWLARIYVAENSGMKIPAWYKQNHVEPKLLLKIFVGDFVRYKFCAAPRKI